MKKIFRKVVTVMISISVLLGITSCRMENSYKKFEIANVTDCNIEDYFTASNLDFARINDVVIIPEIKEINHGEYVIYISAYSKTQSESIEIKDITLSANNEAFLENKIEQNIVLKLNKENVYEGWIEGGEFNEEDVMIHNGQKLELSIELQEGEKIKNSVSQIIYEIQVVIYKSWVTPV